MTRAPRLQPGAGAFSVKVVLALIFVGVFSFSGFMMISAFAPELSSGNDGRAHALSDSAVGFAGIVKLERAQGATVSVSRTRARNANAPLVIFTPEQPATAKEIRARAPHGRVLIILPKWLTVAHPSHLGWVVRADALPNDAIDAVIAPFAPKARSVRTLADSRPRLRFVRDESAGGDVTLESGVITTLQTIQGEGLGPLVTDADGGIILARAGDDPDIYILSDPDFLNTQGIADLATARVGVAMLDMLRDADKPMVFDVTLNGFERDRSILRTAFQPPFLAATLSLAAAAMLLAWRAITQSRPKAPEGRAIALGKRTLADNSAALIRLAHREHKMGWGYAQLVGAQIADRIGIVAAGRDEAFAALDRIGAARGVPRKFTDLAAAAAAAETRLQMLDAARNLYSWKEEMLRAAH